MSALNNQRAVFDVTTGEIVFNLTQIRCESGDRSPSLAGDADTVNVGIVLDVLPQIGADNTVTRTSARWSRAWPGPPSFTAPDGAVFQAPVIDTRESEHDGASSARGRPSSSAD